MLAVQRHHDTRCKVAGNWIHQRSQNKTWLKSNSYCFQHADST